MYTMENMELSEDDNVESGRHTPGLIDECEEHLKPESTHLPLNVTHHGKNDDPLKMMYPNAMTREFAESCLVYSAHCLYIILTLVWLTIWRPLVILLPVAGITW